MRKKRGREEGGRAMGGKGREKGNNRERRWKKADAGLWRKRIG